MKKATKTYELSSSGCFYDSVESSSFKKAREYFSSKWSGKYKITAENFEKNVKL